MNPKQKEILQRLLVIEQELTEGDAALLVDEVEKAEKSLIMLYQSLIGKDEILENGNLNMELVEEKINEAAEQAVNECWISDYEWLKTFLLAEGDTDEDEVDDDACSIIEYAYRRRLWLYLDEDYKTYMETYGKRDYGDEGDQENLWGKVVDR